MELSETPTVYIRWFQCLWSLSSKTMPGKRPWKIIPGLVSGDRITPHLFQSWSKGHLVSGCLNKNTPSLGGRKKPTIIMVTNRDDPTQGAALTNPTNQVGTPRPPFRSCPLSKSLQDSNSPSGRIKVSEFTKVGKILDVFGGVPWIFWGHAEMWKKYVIPFGGLWWLDRW